MSDPIEIGGLFKQVMGDLVEASKVAPIPEGSALTIDVELQIHDVQFDKAKGKLLSRTTSETTRTISLRLATRLTIERK